MKVGYIRVSTEGQNTARQEIMMRDNGVEKVFIDRASGKNANRQGLKALLEFVREGDIVVTESISRIARSTKDLLNIIEDLQNKGVEFVSLKESLDTTTPNGKFVLTVFGAMAELERQNILERQREGIAVAKAEGKYKGRQPIAVDEDKMRKVCSVWRAGDITARQAMKELGLKPNTFYRRVSELGL